MRKFFLFIIVSMLGWGVVSAQTPDVPQGVACELPTVLDTLTGETPVCPTLGTPTVALSETDPNRLVFTTPILGGAVFDGMQAKFVMTVSGVAGTFYTNASLNTDNTKLLGGVAITGDAALLGLDLRGKTLYVTAQITGCHAADAADPTSSAGVATETVSFVVPLPCPAFYDTKDTISGTTYRMISHIQLGSPYQYQNRYFVVKEGGDSLTITATYNSNFEYRSIGLPTSYWEGKIITFYPVLDVKCGSDMSTYVKIVGPSFTRSFVQCPELGNLSLHSNHSSNPYLRQDTLFVTVSNYTAAAVAGVGVAVTPQGTSSSVNWTLDQWTPNHSAAYKVLTLAELQQLGLFTANQTALVTATLTVNPSAQGCNNASVSGQIVLPGLPECPAFASNATTVVTQQGNGTLRATTPLLHYNPALIHHTGVTDQDSLYYTLYVNTTDITQMGSLAGSYPAVYDAQTQTMACTFPFNQVTPGARYDFVPHVNLTGYCNSVSENPITIDGPSGYVVPSCPSYSPTTTAIRNPDGSVTVTHQIVNYNPALMHPTTMPKIYMFDSVNVQRKTRSDIIIDANGLLSCTFPASDFEAYESQNMYFIPRFYRVQSLCGQPGLGPASNFVCIPTANLPTLTALSHSDGMGKVNLFKNEGVILKAKVLAPNNNFSVSQIAQAGFLLSREPITEYSADKAVVGALGGATGDTLSYKVGMDSCGGVTYYRPYVILGGCDPHTVLGPQSSFEMWAPDFTVSANPTHVAAGGSVTLTAVATMTVGSWDQPTSYGIPCQEIPPIANNTCGLPYTDDCSTTKNMEVWMYLLVGLRNCSSFWNSFHGMIYNALGMDPGNADFQYRWERNGSTFFSTATHSAAGVTTDTPTATTVYTGVSDFSYNGVHCVQKRNVTVAVP